MHRPLLLVLAFCLGGAPLRAHAATRKELAQSPFVPPPSATRLKVTAWKRPHLKLKKKKSTRVRFQLDGEFKGRTPWEGQVRPGRHTVRLAGIFNAKKTVMVREGQTAQLNVHFRYGPLVLLLRGVGYVVVGALGLLAAAAGSDEGLKQDIVRVGQSPSGIPIYRFRYRPGFGRNPNVCHEGVLAQDIVQSHPDAVRVGPGGYLWVQYFKLDVRHRRLPRSACAVGVE